MASSEEWRPEANCGSVLTRVLTPRQAQAHAQLQLRHAATEMELWKEVGHWHMLLGSLKMPFHPLNLQERPFPRV